jgi:hypothetical protein
MTLKSEILFSVSNEYTTPMPDDIKALIGSAAYRGYLQTSGTPFFFAAHSNQRDPVLIWFDDPNGRWIVTTIAEDAPVSVMLMENEKQWLRAGG